MGCTNSNQKPKEECLTEVPPPAKEESAPVQSRLPADFCYEDIRNLKRIMNKDQLLELSAKVFAAADTNCNDSIEPDEMLAICKKYFAADHEAQGGEPLSEEQI